MGQKSHYLNLKEIKSFGEFHNHAPDLSVGVGSDGGEPAQAWSVCLLL